MPVGVAVSTFFVAARAEAAYLEKQEAWEAARRVDERVAKAKNEAAKGSEHIDTVLTTMLVIGPGPETIRQYEMRVRHHQEAVIRALQENQERLDLSDERLQELRDQAYVLEDGRRVFRSEDGSWVIDESGTLVSRDELDPDVIEDHRPSAEAWLDAVEENRILQEERQLLIDYQTALDDAEERLSEGGLSSQEIEELDALLDNAPMAVRAHLPDTDPAAPSGAAHQPDAAISHPGIDLGYQSPTAPCATTSFQ